MIPTPDFLLLPTLKQEITLISLYRIAGFREKAGYVFMIETLRVISPDRGMQ